MAGRELQKLSQLILDLESVPDSYREIFKILAQQLANIVEIINLKDINPVSSVAFLQQYNEAIENVEKYGALLVSRSFDPSTINPALLFSEYTESNDEQTISKMYDKLGLNMDKNLVENDPSRPVIFKVLAVMAEKEGDYDRAIALAREGLSQTFGYDIHVRLYELLVRIYEKQKNWLAMIESCQNIIDMPQIAPSSSKIVEAHIARGNACAEFGDLSEAIISHTNALQLQDQHQTPNHPLTSKIYIKIGNVFKKTKDVSAALEYYHKAISCSFPETSSEAYEMIGIMYMCGRNYDLARSNFMKCLEIRQNSIPHETLLLAFTYTWLAQVEHRSGRIDQRDFHIQQARTVADNDEGDREYIAQRISKILAETIPTIS
jgi:tetratricopeptide (TPR) repeat protein